MPVANPMVSVLTDVLTGNILPAMQQPTGVNPLWLTHENMKLRRLSKRVPWSSPPSSRIHNWFEVCYVLGGEASVLIDDHCYLLKANDILVVPSSHEHDFGNTSTDYDALWVEVKETETILHLQQYRKRSYDPRRPGLTLKGTYECYATSQLIRSELHAHQYLHEQLVGDALRRLVIQVLRHLQTSDFLPTSNEWTKPQSLSAAIEVITSSYSEVLSVPDICEKVYLSPSQLNRLFRQHTGKSVWQYITEIRLNRAHHLLLTTDLPVQSVAANVGYQSIHHFGRAFKRAFGYTPGAVRKGETSADESH